MNRLRRPRRVAALVVSALLATAAPVAHAGTIVEESPAATTPHVLDGQVLSVVRVGERIVLGGTFTTARDPDSDEVLHRAGVLAFDATTGRIDPGFDPAPDGTVNVVLPARSGDSVYVGGHFGQIGGEPRDSLALVRLSDGSAVTGFDAGRLEGRVDDLRLTGDRLWVAGRFHRIAGVHRRALATLRADSGRFDRYLSLPFRGVHRGGSTSVAKIDVAPQGDRLVAVGNFRRVDGKVRRQLVQLELADKAARVAPFRTRWYESQCAKVFHTYLRDVDIAPSGRYFVVATTGAYRGHDSPCDTTARFELRAKGGRILPTWVNSTGGDTVLSVEVTDSVVYSGGHARWQNNPYGRNVAGPGAVHRPGIAALDPVNGLPYSWNPTRTRGVGVFDFLADDDGLWVASDTEELGGQHRGRIALLPELGRTLPTVEPPGSLGTVFVGAGTGQLSDPSVLHRVNAGGPRRNARTGLPWGRDKAKAPSAFRRPNQVAQSRPAVKRVARGVPAATPKSIFRSALRSRPGKKRQRWTLPVPAGAPLQVRLYFAPPCRCTPKDAPVQRIRIDGRTVKPRLDVRAAAGGQVGFVERFDVVGDGRLDVVLRARRDRALLSGIEVVRTDLPPAPTTGLVARDRAEGGFTALREVPAGGVAWSSTTGAFMLDGQLYAAERSGRFTRRAFDGHTAGPAVRVDTGDQLARNTAWRREVKKMTGLFYDDGRLYYTLAGKGRLFYRYFTAESDLVGAKRYTASGSWKRMRLATTGGMFLAGGRMHWGTPGGELRSVWWQRSPAHGSPAGQVRVVSGPGTDGLWWTGRTMFALDLS